MHRFPGAATMRWWRESCDTKEPMKILIAPDTRLFVDIDGAGLVPHGRVMRQKPSLILLHGGPGFDHASFKPTFSALADLAQVVYFDHRGHGRSDPRPLQECNLDLLADDVVRLCETLGIERPIVLGQSFGGFVAQRYLARHPGHPAAVILSSTSPHLGLPRKLAMFERLGGAAARDAAERFWSAPGVDTWNDYGRLCRPLYNPGPGDPEGAERTLFDPEILFSWVRGEQQAMSLLPGLANVRCPVLVLAGALDPVCPLEDARDIAAALPAECAQLEVFEGCGHGVWRDRPEAALAAIRRFIEAAHR
jgi:pimeloyl-ACP methyl ester carboxylesterase